jgi:xanthosine utilization system XapX-like protein
MAARKQGRRAVAIVLALLAAGGLGVAAFGNRWLAEPEVNDFGERGFVYKRSAGMGLRDYERCVQTCETYTLFELLDKLDAEIANTKELNLHLPAKDQVPLPRPPWHGFAVVGNIAFFCLLVAAGGLLVGVLIALLRKRVSFPIMPTTIALLGLAGAIVNGCIFVATVPETSQTLAASWTFMTFGAAAVLGLAAVFPLNRAIRPIDVELGEASATMSWGASRDSHP